MQWLEFISSVPLFRELPDNQLVFLARSAREKTYAAGQIIVGDSDKTDALYLLQKGRIKLSKSSFNGKEQTIHIFGPGDLLGLCTVFTGTVFPASAVAMEKSRMLLFSREALEKTAYDEPSLLINLVFELSMRLKESMEMIEALALKEIPQRLASFLMLSVSMDKDDTFLMPFSQRELAKVLGATPETLSRSLRRMIQDNMIQVEGRYIRILDKAAIRDLAE